jgi:hypothetical protein
MRGRDVSIFRCNSKNWIKENSLRIINFKLFQLPLPHTHRTSGKLITLLIIEPCIKFLLSVPYRELRTASEREINEKILRQSKRGIESEGIFKPFFHQSLLMAKCGSGKLNKNVNFPLTPSPHSHSHIHTHTHQCSGGRKEKFL